MRSPCECEEKGKRRERLDRMDGAESDDTILVPDIG